jgi:hypothetical protein
VGPRQPTPVPGVAPRPPTAAVAGRPGPARGVRGGLALAVRLAGAAGLAAALSGCGRAALSGPPTTTTPAPPATSTTLAPIGYLADYGATVATWDADHHPDPLGTGGFWPRLSNGLDTYVDVRFVDGRALEYRENLDPPVSASTALSVLGDELPPDARVLLERTAPPGAPVCEQIVEASPTLRTLAHVDVLAELWSSGEPFDPNDVVAITYAPVASPAAVGPCGTRRGSGASRRQ